MSKKPLSLDDFKKWMETQEEDTAPSEDVEVKVQSLISPRKLAAKMTVEEGEEEELAKDFSDNGGIVLETNDETLLIKVDTGSFYLNGKYVEQV